MLTFLPASPHPFSSWQGIFVDAEGNVSEGPNMNIACLLVRPTVLRQGASRGSVGWLAGRRQAGWLRYG